MSCDCPQMGHRSRFDVIRQAWYTSPGTTKGTASAAATQLLPGRSGSDVSVPHQVQSQLRGGTYCTAFRRVKRVSHSCSRRILSIWW
jgi:hypothetical protein